MSRDVMDLTPGESILLSALEVGDHYAMAGRSFAPVGLASQFAFDVENRARDRSPPSNLSLRVPVELACNDTSVTLFGHCPRLLYVHSMRLSGDAANTSSCKVVESDYRFNPLKDSWPNNTLLTKVPLLAVSFPFFVSIRTDICM